MTPVTQILALFELKTSFDIVSSRERSTARDYLENIACGAFCVKNYNIKVPNYPLPESSYSIGLLRTVT